MIINGTSPGAVMREASEELRAQGYKEEAIEIAHRAVEWYQQHRSEADYRYPMAQALYLAEIWQESRALFEGLSKEEPENIDYKGYLGTLAVRMGDKKKALSISEELKNIDRPYLFGNHTYWRACIASLLGDKERAVNLLTEAFNQGRSYGVYLHKDMNLEPLRDYPSFKELMKPKG